MEKPGGLRRKRGDMMKWVFNRLPKTSDPYTAFFSIENALLAREFHGGIPGYAPTPLADLSGMASRLGLKGLYVKDESPRFDLNAFKVLGASYAMSRYAAKITGRDRLSYDELISDRFREEVGQLTFFTATDGNHGRGVAWSARRLGQKAVVYMPRGTTAPRLRNILAEGADASIKEYGYDECVRQAAADAARTPGSVLMQDTAWEGYEEIPLWIMQGYGTLAIEADLQLRLAGCQKPSHIFIQSGVGSFPAAMQAYFATRYPSDAPKVIILEASAADCFYRGAEALDGKPRTLEGHFDTIMAGLACGTPSTIAWDIIKNHSACFISCPDWVAAKGMRMLGFPLRGDPVVISGESGAVGMGAIAAIMELDEYKELRDALGIDGDSRVLLFSTEGDTDPEHYRQVVWNGDQY